MSTAEQRQRMGATVINFEARRDKAGLLTVYRLPPGDGGGTYEVAGINDRYHPELAAKLKALVEAGKQKEAEAEASAFIIDYTKTVQPWHSDAGVEFYLRDSAFNRGPAGAARILQMSVGVAVDGEVGPQTLAAVAKLSPHDLLDKLRAGREAYERSPFVGRNESSAFWKGLVNRWNNALAAAIRFSAEAPAPAPSKPGRSLVSVLADLLAAWFGKGKVAAPAPKVEPGIPVSQSADRWMSISAREIGVKETAGATSTPRIIEYRKIAGCDLKGDDGAVAWCKIYVNAMMTLAGLPIAKNWMARSIESDPNFVRLSGPAIGAVCSFWRTSKAGSLGHTGFYRGETASGKVLVEGGNESDAVRRAFYPKNGQSMGLVGCYWPKSVPLPATGAVYVDDDGSPVASAV